MDEKTGGKNSAVRVRYACGSGVMMHMLHIHTAICIQSQKALCYSTHETQATHNFHFYFK